MNTMNSVIAFIAMIAVVVATPRYTYKVTTFTVPAGACGSNTPGTANAVYVSIKSLFKTTSFMKLNNPNKNDFQPAARDVFHVRDSKKVENIRCLVFKITGSDAFALDKAIVGIRDTETTFYNYERIVLSTDSTEGVSSMKLCKQGNVKYKLVTTTSTNPSSDTDRIFLSMRMDGKLGKTGRTGLIGNHPSAFEKGATNTFYFNNLPYFNLKCITFTANKGGTDMWRFQKVTVTRLSRSSKTYVFNTYGAPLALSYDYKNAKRSIKMCI